MNKTPFVKQVNAAASNAKAGFHLPQVNKPPKCQVTNAAPSNAKAEFH